MPEPPVFSGGGEDESNIFGREWHEHPADRFVRDPGLLYFLTGPWAVYLLPAILSAALVEAKEPEEEWSLLGEILKSFFCDGSSPLATMFSRHIRNRHNLSETQRAVVFDVVRALHGIGYVDDIEPCVLKRFDEPVYESPLTPFD